MAYEKSDASLFEINPVFKTSDNLIFAADAKVNIDDNALYRHPEYEIMRDISEEDPTELEAGKYNFSPKFEIQGGYGIGSTDGFFFMFEEVIPHLYLGFQFNIK